MTTDQIVVHSEDNDTTSPTAAATWAAVKRKVCKTTRRQRLPRAHGRRYRQAVDSEIRRGDLVGIKNTDFVEIEFLSCGLVLEKNVGVVLENIENQYLKIKFMHNGLCGGGAGLQGSIKIVQIDFCHIIRQDFARRQMNEGDFIGLEEFGFECEESEESDADED